MGKFVDLTGQRFGRLVVIERAQNASSGAAWLCQCTCGAHAIVSSNMLRTGRTKSCGCLAREATKLRSTTHGGSYTRLYHIWSGMRQRCHNSKSPAFNNYGGRGITVCPEWLHDFEIFQKWALSHGYRDDLTIDRINNDKGYSPDNCRWATYSTQRKNQRRCAQKWGCS